jgi:AraC-like DNA-binding protein
MFHYAERHCPEALRPWLWNYWEFGVDAEAGPQRHHVPPDGCTSILIGMQAGSSPRIVASGPWIEPFVVPIVPHTRYWGVRCRPESGGLVLEVPAEKLRGLNQPVATLAPRLEQGLRQSLAHAEDFGEAVERMNDVFSAHLARTPTPHAVVVEAVNQLVASGGELAVGVLARKLGCSPRTLLRRFREATGLSPKQFSRICRFRLAATTLLEPDHPGWAKVASGSGFADQAHMIHEFKDLTGLTPESLGRRVRATRHGDLIV